jgi:hypothetical protein
MKKERFIYGIDIGEHDNFDEMTDKAVIEEGERTGIVYSIEGFIDELNSDHLDTEQYWFKII